MKTAQIVTIGFGVVAIGVVGLIAAPAAGEPAHTATTHSVTIDRANTTDNADGDRGAEHVSMWIEDDGREIRIEINNGHVQATLNGEPIPSDQIIVKDDGGIVLLDESGDAIFSSTDGDEGGFRIGGNGAIIDRDDEGVSFEWRDGRSAEIAEQIAVELTKQGASGDGPPRAVIGVTLGQIGEALAAQLGIDPADVTLINGVRPGLPADKAGVKAYDIVIEVDGEAPASSKRLSEVISAKEPGESVSLRVLRAGKPITLKVVVKKFEPTDWTQSENKFFFDRESPDGAGGVRLRMREVRDRLHELQGRSSERSERADRIRDHIKEVIEKEMRGLNLDEKTQRKIEEAMKTLQKKLEDLDVDVRVELPEIRFFRSDNDDDVLIVPRPPLHINPPSHIEAPRPPRGIRGDSDHRNAELASRLEELESRMAHIERLLERLVEDDD